MLQDARNITQAMKLGALGAPAYQAFSLKDIEDATNNFDTSTFVLEGSYSQMYIGKLKDGSLIAIRCLKINKNTRIIAL
ncbi:probable inactive leucine-rich repeat receptor-like protein kinase At3g03770 [Daucus carota subsp. sativus]|uniref:probable inactive leucine-rich repeat receptor-like protein kinase At3g03770 n=1 Tax=Daucus carota subsp. sativus TaxID=79200 RepID=UPI0007EF0F11|nr:PREDICTED: probable inactive leucine-rich repeat receptor-like protein kinase At3g03770 [Daucus carota subsp. sativus]